MCKYEGICSLGNSEVLSYRVKWCVGLDGWVDGSVARVARGDFENENPTSTMVGNKVLNRLGA